ncbi:unnamed protein product, partial [marine sediment metagenome]
IEKFCIRGKILEVGCGVGSFLDEAQKRGWEVRGVEISKWASDYCVDKKDIIVHQGTLKTCNYNKNYFNTILYYHAIEHIVDPVSELKLAGSFLKRNGFIVIGVPNLRSFQAKKHGLRWSALIPEHIYLFVA